MAVVLTCDRCGAHKSIPYSELITREDVGKSPFGEVYIPCKCGGTQWVPYRIIEGKIAPTTNGFEDSSSKVTLMSNEELESLITFI